MMVAVVLLATSAIIGVRLLRRSSPKRGSGETPDADPASDVAFDKPNPKHPPGPSKAGARAKPESDDTLAAWRGTATQFEGGRSDAASADLVVGLDFGTSCTKVVVRSPFIAGARAVAVRWHSDGGGNAYLLPTELWMDVRGELHLRPAGDAAGERFTDIKISLMDQPADERSKAVAAAYLGLALRRARRWFLDTQADIYGRHLLRWGVNLGIPSAGYADEQVRATFGLVARAAWELSLDAKAPTLASAFRACRSAENGGYSDADTRIEVVPEIVAEVVGYARSRKRRNGLHVVVDAGASTLDICGFNLHAPEGEDNYELFTALVERLGLNELHLKRLATVRRAGARSPTPITALDPSSPIPVRGIDYVEGPSNALRERLAAVDDRYVFECTNSLMRILMELRKSMDPHAEAWKSGLPVFLAGGGRDFELVGQATSSADERLTKYVKTVGIRPRVLPKPETLVNEDVPDGRIDVAYGLSFDSFESGEIHAPAEISDVENPPKPMDWPDTSKDALQ